MIWFSAFILGLLGSFHCIGMCGPIAMAIPGGKKNSRHINLFLYNSGRIITYASFGLIFGIIGKGFFLAGIQQNISIVVGALILLYVLFTLISGTDKLEKITVLHIQIKKYLSKLFKVNSKSSVLGIGLMNGFLPCGLVYVAIAGAVAMADPLEGTAYMAMFGLGTIPVMAAITLVKNYLTIDIRSKIRKLIPFAIAAMAILLIVRGLNLGIPYISPKIEIAKTEMKCH